MKPTIIRVIGYAILFLISMVFLNMDHTTPGSDDPPVEAPFWALFTVAYAISFTLAIAGLFEKLFAEQTNNPSLPKSWFVISSVLTFLIGLHLEYDSGYLRLEIWYDYLPFFIYGILLLSLYSDVLSEVK